MWNVFQHEAFKFNRGSTIEKFLWIKESLENHEIALRVITRKSVNTIKQNMNNRILKKIFEKLNRKSLKQG